MRRREFIALVGSTAIARPLAVRAQQPKVPTIGILVRAAPGWQQFWQSFREALRDLDYIEGQNIRFEFRSDQGQISHLPELAAELVRLKVDVIVAWYTPAAIAAKRATHDTPIVCARCGDLVATGLVESLARPGANVTAAKAATLTIPVVFSVGGDPIELGLVSALNRPGGNLTGVYTLEAYASGEGRLARVRLAVKS
jgi:putative ABC transport system substrate-binding protein